MRSRARRPVRGGGRGHAGVSDSDLFRRARSSRGYRETNSQTVAPGREFIMPARPRNSETPWKRRHTIKPHPLSDSVNIGMEIMNYDSAETRRVLFVSYS